MSAYDPKRKWRATHSERRSPVRSIADTSTPAPYQTRALDQFKAKLGSSRLIRADNGPEFARILLLG